ncbi:hypothetical protein SAMN05192550_1841 [Flavobacterium glycines]|uniref:Uncharacterized protein n=1 Tax=Flavobacterium glycines TaxID=551990 RepID=A0A1G8SKF3_9FLAO|nr:hypothetical protein SAMN05192550_1841 [Flavobacterium glycines]
MLLNSGGIFYLGLKVRPCYNKYSGEADFQAN